jgi:hypothetical protein
MKPRARVLGVLLLSAVFANANIMTVSPGNLGNWSVTTTDGSVTSSFVSGPATPPLGTGSLQFQIGADGSQFIILRDDADIVGTSLTDLSALSYSTYQQNYENGQAVYLSLVLSNGDKLFFEPIYQTGTYGGDPVPNQCPGVTNCAGLNQWQTWNALTGGWWANSGFELSAGGPPVFTLADYAADTPGVTISAIRLSAGAGGTWGDFKGNADALTVGTTSGSTTFDFETGNLVPEPRYTAWFGIGMALLAGAARKFWPLKAGARPHNANKALAQN